MGTRLGTELGTRLGTVLGTDLGGGGSAPPSPSLSGAVWIGDTLTVTSTAGGPYQWKRDGADIVGATSSSYVVTPSDIGPDITVTDGAQTTAAVRCYFDTVAQRSGPLSDWIAGIDNRDYSAGALTTLTCRATGTTYTGTGTLDTSVNSKKTLVLNGTTDGFTSTSNVAMSGYGAHTTVFGMLATTNTTSKSFVEYGATPTTAASMQWGLYSDANNFVYSSMSGASHSQGWSPITLSTACVVSAVGDFFGTYEAREIFGNGIALTPNNGQGTNDLATVFGAQKLSIGQREGGTRKLGGKFLGAIAVFRRRLTWEERNVAELIVGYLSGVSVTYAAQTSPGAMLGESGQSNQYGYSIATVGTIPSPWPPVDTAASLKNASTSGVSVLTGGIAAVEPFNTGAGARGASNVTSFMDQMKRNGYGGYALISGYGKPLNGSAVTAWIPGTSAYKDLVSSLYTAKFVGGWKLVGLIWSQGETEATSNNATTANDHLTYTQSIFSQLRIDLRDPAFRIVVPRIHATNPGGYSTWNTVRDRQLLLADANTLVVDEVGTLDGDNLHLTSLAQMDMGALTIWPAYLAKWPVAP